MESPSAAPQLCKYSLYSCTVKNPHRSDLHRFTRTSNACMCQQHDMCPHLTCDWCCVAPKGSSFNKSPKTKHSQNETYWTAADESAVCVCSQNQEQQRRSFTLQTLSRTDRSTTQEAAQDLPAVFISQGWIMSRVRAVGSVQLCLINICLSMRMWSAIITRVYYYQCLRIVKLRCVLHKHFHILTQRHCDIQTRAVHLTR